LIGQGHQLKVVSSSPKPNMMPLVAGAHLVERISGVDRRLVHPLGDVWGLLIELPPARRQLLGIEPPPALAPLYAILLDHPARQGREVRPWPVCFTSPVSAKQEACVHKNRFNRQTRLK